MPDVVEERRGEGVLRVHLGDSLLGRELGVDGAEAREEELHHEGRADRVSEARVLRAGKRDRRDAELANAPKPLHLGRVEEELDDALLLGLEGDEPVDWVAKNHGDERIWVL